MSTEQTEVPAAEPPAAGTAVVAASRTHRAKKMREPGERRWLAIIFIGPAAILLAVVLLYPLVWSAIRSLFEDGPAGTTGGYVGLRNYGNVFTNNDTLNAVKNNLIWVVIAPTVITIVGLIFAVLSERVRWATAFKLVLFMPMAISFLASGVTFALIYADQPSRGLGNAIAVGIHDTFFSSSKYPQVHARGTTFAGSPKTGYTSTASFSPGTPALVPLVGLSLDNPPKSLQQAALPSATNALSGVVWNDFHKGGGGTVGQVDQGELGLKGIKVQAVQGGKVVASTTANAQGQFVFSGLTSGSYQLKLPSSNFASQYNGISWLGSNTFLGTHSLHISFITLSIMIAYLWIYAGFAMVLLAAGMAAIPRDALEAARIDGATEWQVFRRVTVPLLAPVLMVVFVTLVINVLKIFDIVFVLSQEAGGSGKSADVLATQLFSAYGQQRYGIASAIGVVLVLVVIPFMLINIRRFRREQQ